MTAREHALRASLILETFKGGDSLAAARAHALTAQALAATSSSQEAKDHLLREAARWIRGDHGYRENERGCQALVRAIEMVLG